MEINEYLLRLFQVIKDSGNQDLFAGASSALSRTEFRLLREIVYEQERGNDIISSELARRLGITRSAISQIVGKLEKRGIVERVDSPTDRKIAYVRLSKYAKAVYDAQCSRVNAIMELVEKDIGTDQIELLILQLQKFAEAMGRARKKIDENSVPQEK